MKCIQCILESGCHDPECERRDIPEHQWMHNTARILVVAEISEAVAVINGRGLCSYHVTQEIDQITGGS